MSVQAVPSEKTANTSEQSKDTEQVVCIDRVPTIEVDNYKGLTFKCVIVYLVRAVLPAVPACRTLMMIREFLLLASPR